MAEDARNGSIAGRAVKRLARPATEELQRGQEDLADLLTRMHGDLGRMHEELQEVTARVRAIEVDAGRAAAFSRYGYDEEPENRRRLWALRESEQYELAFTEPEPLVTFVVPTYTSYETLRDVALPSILGQSYSNLEVIVVGDAAPPQTEGAIAAIDDPRVRYYNRPYRGPYPEDRSRRWYVIGTPPLNEAFARARGRWIATLGDDDAVRPTHTEQLLAAAREQRWEHCYGKQLVNFVEGEPMTLGLFPPELGEWGLQSALLHSGLRFFEVELADAAWPEPNDWSICRRMMRAGVRTGMIDEIVVDKFETRRASSEAWKHGDVPEVD